MSRVVGARVPNEIAQLLDQKAAQQGFRTRSEILREELIRFATEQKDCSSRVNARKQQEIDLGQAKSCPLLRFVDLEHCARCPFQDEKVQEHSESSDTNSDEESSADPLDELMGHLSRNRSEQ